MASLLYQARSAHQEICVAERRGVRFLRFGGERSGWQGAAMALRPERLVLPYQQAFSLHTALRPVVRRFLCIGVGTGTAITHVFRRHPQAKITGVDIDGEVLHVARKYFAVPDDPRVKLVQADARPYVARLADRFDLAFLDAYYHEETPKTFLSPVYLSAVSDRLEPGGLFVANVIMASAGPLRKALDDLCQTLRQTIGPVWVLNVGLMPYCEQNVILFAQKSPTRVADVRDVRRRAKEEIATHPAVYGRWSGRLPGRIQRY